MTCVARLPLRNRPVVGAALDAGLVCRPWSILASTVAAHSTVILGLGPRIQRSAGDEHGERGDT